MPQICLYLQLHQPYRLSDWEVTDLNSGKSYFFDKRQLNKTVFEKVAQKSYRPMLRLLNKLVKEHPNFCGALSCSGIFLDQAVEFAPDIIEDLRHLAKSGRIEFLSETYYHSLAALYSPSEFRIQVRLHQAKIERLFGVKTTVFRNTELIYDNRLPNLLKPFNFLGMITEGVDRYLQNRSQTHVFIANSPGTESFPLLLKHSQLSDDLAFRFSDKKWQWFPLTMDRYWDWLHVYQSSEIINLFMDFETFGEHQWADTGIFNFFEKLVVQVSQDKFSCWITPSQVFRDWQQKKQQLIKECRSRDRLSPQVTGDVYDVPQPISWADIDRDLTAWTGNDLQTDTLNKLYSLEKKVIASQDKKLIDDWRRLQTSDHFYYMCTKWSADGDVHAYFSPYGSPFEAYRRYAIILADLQDRVRSATIKS